MDLLALELWERGIRIVFGVNENERGKNKTKKTEYFFGKLTNFYRVNKLVRINYYKEPKTNQARKNTLRPLKQTN